MSGRRPDAHAATPADTPRELADRRLAGRLRRRFTGSPRWLWIGNLVLLMGSAAWIVADPVLHAAFSSEGLSATDWDMGRASGFVIVLSAAAIQLVWLASGMWIGALPFRRLKSLIILVALISLWLGLALNCQNLAWQGRRWRLGPYVSVVEVMSQPLIKSWPGADGDVEGLGPFMAYPVGRPTTLILLTPPQLAAHGPSISAVEKSAAGAIRFELNDAGGNDWLEWHPHSVPESHVGGLHELRDMERATLLTEKWYLVRYRGTSCSDVEERPAQTWFVGKL